MYELRLLCPEADVDVICEALDALDALSVSVEDADAHTEAEQPLFGEPGMPAPREGWQRSLLSPCLRRRSRHVRRRACCSCRTSLADPPSWACRTCPSRTGCA
jgi:ferric iron reductase protein FhuF